MRVAEAGRHRRFGAGLDLEVVDERAGDAVEVGERLGAGPGARFAQREVEGVERERAGARRRPRPRASARRPRRARLGRGHASGAVPLRVGRAARSAARSCSAASTSASFGSSADDSASTSASSRRSASASATSVSTTPSSAAAASSRSRPRRFSASSAREPAAALAHRLDPHERVGERRRAPSGGERVLGVEHARRRARAGAPARAAPRSASSSRCVAQALEPGLAGRRSRGRRGGGGSRAAPRRRRRAGGRRRPALERPRAGGRTSRSRSLRRSRLPSVASSRRSARSRRLRNLRMPAASSMIARRSSGRAFSTVSSWPWPTITCCWRPMPVSESSSWMSSSRHGAPLIWYSDSPVRNSVRVIVTSVNSIGSRRGGVVDRERHLGPAERGPVGVPGEDDVVHLAAAQRARTLGAEHPGDRVDEVRLARAVRARRRPSRPARTRARSCRRTT